MQMPVRHTVISRPVQLYRWVLCAILALFMLGSKAAEATLTSPYPQCGNEVVIKSHFAHLSSQVHAHVEHPGKVKHVIRRRRQSHLSQGVYTDHLSTHPVAGYYGDCHPYSGSGYATPLRPTYYVFLFRYALF